MDSKGTKLAMSFEDEKDKIDKIKKKKKATIKIEKCFFFKETEPLKMITI